MTKRIYSGQTVFEAALDRMRWLFDEFENIYVNFSGGKDSTVVLQLALIAAEEKGRLPVKVLFLDQEAEWQATVDMVRQTMDDPRVEPYWMQVPIRLFNATSTDDPWLYCWKEGADWLRDKEPDAITENVYDSDRFADFFGAFLRHHHPDEPVVNICGIRTEESPGRLVGLTTYATYKGETWGKVRSKARGHYDMYPIYDWSYRDVWKAIHEHGWPYNRLYDYLYQYGIPVLEMRVSNVHHETALQNLFFMQEIEPETWEKLTQRVRGINTAGTLTDNIFCPKQLPFMFSSWREYRDHLLENLITDAADRAAMRHRFAKYDDQFGGDYPDAPKVLKRLVKVQIDTVLINDLEYTKLENFRVNFGKYTKTRRHRYGLA